VGRPTRGRPPTATTSWENRSGEYLAEVAKILPGGELFGDEAHPGAWAVRVNGRPTLDLQLLLTHQDAWLAAIAALRDRLRELQRQLDGQ